jgi:ribosome-associated protein
MGQTMQIDENTVIPDSEFVFKASRSSGPGGQNVNKVNTRITLLFDVAASPSLSNPQKHRILSRLSTRADRHGVIRVASQKERTQEANRRAAVERLRQLLTEALKRRPVRKKTAPTAGARERRLKEKKRRSVQKQQRARRDWLDE